MEIGKQRETVTVYPLVNPASFPKIVEQPVVAPAPIAVPEREKVPAGR